MVLFARNPEQWRKVIDDRGALVPAVEEILRYWAPSQYQGRCSTVATEWHGVTIPANEPVLLITGAANRDERAYEDPDRFDVERPLKLNVGFGHGIHTCLGAALARLESRDRVRRDRGPVARVRRRRGRRCERVNMSNVAGYSNVPVTIPASAAPSGFGVAYVRSRRRTTPKRGRLLAGQAEDPRGEDVLVHLGGAAGDGERPHVDAVAAPGAGVGVGAEDVAGDLAEVLLGLAPHELGDAALGPDVAAVHRAGDRPFADELEQLALEVEAGQAWRFTGSPSAPSSCASSRSRRILPRSPRCRLATVPRSYASVVIATRQPSCSGPSSASTGTRTSVKKISLNSFSPVIVTSGRTSTPGQRHVDEQARDAAVLRRLGIGAHEQLAPVGEVAERVPRLLAVDHEVVAVEHRAALQRREVGARVRLGEALAPDVVAAQHAGQELLLLLVGAELDDRGRDVREPERVQRARRAASGASPRRRPPAP